MSANLQHCCHDVPLAMVIASEVHLCSSICCPHPGCMPCSHLQTVCAAAPEQGVYESKASYKQVSSSHFERA